MIFPSQTVSVSIRSNPTGSLLDQRDGHLEHALERVDADPLVRLLVALGAVRQIRALQPFDDERVGVRAAPRDNLTRLVAAGLQAALRQLARAPPSPQPLT